MVIALVSKPGLSSATTLSIPKTWDASWFRNLISNQLKGADVRNAIGTNGISVTGNISSPYATIGFGAPVTLPGPVTITAPVSGTSLTVNAPLGGVSINASSRSSTAIFAQDASIASSQGDYPYFGYNVEATNSVGVYDYIVSDFASAIQFISGGFQFKTAVSGTAGNPITWTVPVTISNAGAINATSYYLNGVLVFQSGTFTGTLTGCTTAPTATFHYTIADHICTISMANGTNLTGTSNSTSMTITGMPAVCEPATQTPILPCVVEDNSLLILTAAEINPGLGTIIFLGANVNGTKVQYTGGGFTASGTKGMDSTTFSYSLQ